MFIYFIPIKTDVSKITRPNFECGNFSNQF